MIKEASSYECRKWLAWEGKVEGGSSALTPSASQQKGLWLRERRHQQEENFGLCTTNAHEFTMRLRCQEKIVETRVPRQLSREFIFKLGVQQGSRVSN